MVGSLLRPEYLLEARADFNQGRISLSKFKDVEDRAVRQVVSLQEEVDLPVLTDGEMRRESFQSTVTRQIRGFGDLERKAFLWGQWHSEEYGDLTVERPESLSLTRKLDYESPIFLQEFVSLRTLTDQIPKLTVPSPGLFLNFWSEENTVYDSKNNFVSDLIEIYRREIKILIEAGLQYLQIDAPHYPLLLDDDYRSYYGKQNDDLSNVLECWAEWDNRVIDGWEKLTTGIHLCRGNQGSRWLVEGSYEPISDVLFNNLDFDRFLLEFDDERSGSFKPVQSMPEDKQVMLGLVSTKHSELKSPDTLRREVQQAADYHPKVNLGICPQCGFSSSTVGNKLDQEDQKRKLERLVQTANMIDWE